MESRAEKRARMKHHEMSQSNAVIDLKRDADELAGAVRGLKGTAAAALAERLRTVLRDGEEMPDVELVFELLGRLVERRRHQVEEADGERWVRGMDLYTLRMECRKAKDRLYAEATWIRGALVELCGSKRCRTLFGLAARTPRGAAELADEVERLVRRLGRPDLRLPAPPGLRFDPSGWIEILKPRLARLTELLAELEAVEARSQGHVREERKIQATCRQTHLLVARSLEALFTLAGEETLARSLRSEARRRSSRKKPRQRTVASAARKVLRPALATILDWLRRLFGRLKLSPPDPPGGATTAHEPNLRNSRVSPLAEGFGASRNPPASAGAAALSGPQPPCRHRQRGAEGRATVPPGPAAGS